MPDSGFERWMAAIQQKCWVSYLLRTGVPVFPSQTSGWTPGLQGSRVSPNPRTQHPALEERSGFARWIFPSSFEEAGRETWEFRLTRSPLAEVSRRVLAD